MPTKTFQEYMRESTPTSRAVLIAVPKNPQEGDGRGYWRIGKDVYRAAVNGSLDVYGFPMDKRWESSYDHFVRFWPTVHATHYTKTREWK